MNALSTPDTDELLEMARSGDGTATEQLFARHRRRLRQMVAARLDRRIVQRVDPSDVVQETLIEAHRLLPRYLQEQPLPFYPWLRQIAWNRLVDLHRRHVQVRKRTVTREEPQGIGVSSRSADVLARRLAAPGTSPSRKIQQREMRERVQTALARLPEPMREVLVMRHVEQLSVLEIAAVQDVAEGTVKSRHFRALELLRRYLEEDNR